MTPDFFGNVNEERMYRVGQLSQILQETQQVLELTLTLAKTGLALSAYCITKAELHRRAQYERRFGGSSRPTSSQVSPETVAGLIHQTHSGIFVVEEDIQDAEVVEERPAE
jgi:hypothetical protein